MTAAQWLEVLISYSLQVLIVVTACKLIERVIAVTSDRCAVWNTCFISILVLGATALTLPRLHVLQPWSRLQPQTLLTVGMEQAIIGKTFLWIWCIGASVSFIRWMARVHLLRRSLRRCKQLPAGEVQQLLGLTNTGTAGAKLPAVMISDEADGPFCWQFHQATIVLPCFLYEGNREELRHVLVHELEHLKTNHPFQLFMQNLAQTVCWFHPAVWSAGSWASLMREFTCDEAAAAQGANSAAYLRTLLRIAERCEQKRNSSAIGFTKTPSEIVLRARRLVDLAGCPNQTIHPRRFGRKSAACSLIAVTCLLCLVWVPSDPMASTRSAWSPWPTWSANAFHCFGISLRDYEQYDRRIQAYEILHTGGSEVSAIQESLAIKPDSTR